MTDEIEQLLHQVDDATVEATVASVRKRVAEGSELDAHVIRRLFETAGLLGGACAPPNAAQARLVARTLAEACVLPRFATLAYTALLSMRTTGGAAPFEGELARPGAQPAAPCGDRLPGDFADRLAALPLSEAQQLAILLAMAGAPSATARIVDMVGARCGGDYADRVRLLFAEATPEVFARLAADSAAAPEASAAWRRAVDAALETGAGDALAAALRATLLPPGEIAAAAEAGDASPSIVALLREFGPWCASSAARLDALRACARAEFCEADAAALIALLAADPAAAGVGAAALADAYEALAGSALGRHDSALRAWDVDVVVRALGGACAALDPLRIAEALDAPDLHCRNAARLLDVFQKLVGAPLPPRALQRVWCNREGMQLPLLHEVMVRREPSLDDEAYNALVSTALALSFMGHLTAAEQLLSAAADAQPRRVLVALAACKTHSRLRQAFVRRLERDLVTMSAPPTRVVEDLWAASRAAVVESVAQRCAQPRDFRLAYKMLAGLQDGVATALRSDFGPGFSLGVAIAQHEADGDDAALAAWLQPRASDDVRALAVALQADARTLAVVDAAVSRAKAAASDAPAKPKEAAPKADADPKGLLQYLSASLSGSLSSYGGRLLGGAPPADDGASPLPSLPSLLQSSLAGLSLGYGADARDAELAARAALATDAGDGNGNGAAHDGTMGGANAYGHAAPPGAGGAPPGGAPALGGLPRPPSLPSLGGPALGGGNDALMHAALDRSASLVSTDGPEQERALGMGELMPAALDVVPSVAPTEVVLDCVHMVFNNVSSSNLDAKVKDIAPLLREENYGWFANYLVVKRISTQPNFHALYLAFLEKLGADEPKQLLLKAVIQAVFHNIAKLLRSGKITTSTSERSLLKNLGSWLGQITLARNRPILQRSLDVKELLYQGFESGRLIAICPFVAKILEGAKTSIVFRPPNPWLMGLMGVLRDLYDVDELKMNIKFEIEVLCKHLGVKLEDIAGAAHGLSRRLQPVKDRNPDFNVKRPAPSESLGGGAFGPPPPQAAPSSPPPLPPSLQQQMALGGPQPGMGAQGMGAQHAFAPRSGDAARPGEHAQQHPQQMQPRAAPAARAEAFGAPYSGDTQTVIPNLASYITVSAAAGVHGAALRRVAPVAVDRAIREIIQPVVERSVTIACITTKEIVAKDFATEPDEARARKAAQLMVANLAGSLALVTCKEPLRVSIAKHLRALLAATPELAAMDAAATAAVQTCAAENLDLGCMLIEKAATEKAIRDVDDALGPALHKGRLQHARALELMREGGPRFPAALPEPLRPRQPLLQQQLLVYEAFHRAPRGGQQPQPQAAPAAQPKASGQSSPTAAAAPGPAPRPAAAVPGPPRERRGGAAALSAVAQAGAAVLPSISIAELMELYRAATAKLDAEFVALARQPNAELLAFSQLRNHAVFRHVNELLLAAARVEKSSRDDAALAIAQSTFKAMCSKSALEPPVRLETLAIVLAASADTAPLVRDELANWIAFLPAHTDADRYLHAHVLVRLLGVELLGASELDAYLAHNMDSGRSQPWLEITLGFVELSVATYRLAAFPADFARVAAVLENVARQPQPQPALRRLVTRLNAAGAVAKQQQLQAQAAASASNEAMAAAANAAAADAHRAAQQQQPRAPGKAQQQQAADLQQYARRSGVSAHEPSAGGAQGEGDSPAAREQVTALVEQWIRVWNDSPGSEKAYATYVALLSQHAVPRDAQATEKFVRLATSVCVEACVSSAKAAPNYDGAAAGDDTELSYAVVDAYAKLLVLIVKYASSSDAAAAAGPKHSTDRRLDVLNRVLATLIRALVADYDSAANFDQRPYFRLFLNLLQDLNVPDPVMDSSNPRVLAAFATAFHALQPAMVPGFAFSWLELVSHRMFMPNLLLASDQKGWILMHRLLVDLFVFLEPYLRKVALSEAVRLLYKGALRVLLVLLHDFPEFLSDYHFSFCDVIPPSCIQLRNLFLSAFPRSMRLPDPFTPNLKVDLLPEISRPPRMLSNCAVALDASDLRAPLDEYLRTRHPISFLLDLPRKLRARPPATPDRDAYDVALVNALVVYVGTTAIAQLHANKSGASPPIAHSTPIDIFQHLMNNLDAEGRYFLLNAIANQLRYPNNHTHYFSCVLLYLFAEATSEYIQEQTPHQVTRVLLERLIVHRPHPWGLLITFIELIKNPRYSFWSHNFTHCATEIERVFESVARSCMGPGHAAAMQPEMPEA